jgi:hypothetical protein
MRCCSVCAAVLMWVPALGALTMVVTLMQMLDEAEVAHKTSGAGRRLGGD